MTLSQLFLSGLMLIAGIGIPVMAAWNADLGSRIANPMAAVFLLSLAALIVSSGLLIFSGTPTLGALKQVPPLYYLAGALFVLYMASITFAAPRIGLANAVFYVLLGQLIRAAIIDPLACGARYNRRSRRVGYSASSLCCGRVSRSQGCGAFDFSSLILDLRLKTQPRLRMQ